MNILKVFLVGTTIIVSAVVCKQLVELSMVAKQHKEVKKAMDHALNVLDKEVEKLEEAKRS